MILFSEHPINLQITINFPTGYRDSVAAPFGSLGGRDAHQHSLFPVFLNLLTMNGMDQV